MFDAEGPYSSSIGPLKRLIAKCGPNFVSFGNKGPVHLAYNPSYSACFFNRNSIFLSQKISQQCFSAGL
jgi:hypothetical protein